MTYEEAAVILQLASVNLDLSAKAMKMGEYDYAMKRIRNAEISLDLVKSQVTGE